MEKVTREEAGKPPVFHAPGTASRSARECFYRLAALAVLLASIPVLAVAALAVLLDDGLPVLYRQNRVGRRNRLFQLLKFRSMRNGVSGPAITAASDTRITRTGAILRKYKLDELPQLWNVVRGDMSLVGPRPEVPRYVDYEDRRWQEVLEDSPGLTDLATLVYRNEEEVLAGVANPETYYREVLLPDKLQLNLCYRRNRTLRSDLKLILATVRYSFLPAGFDATLLRKTLLEELGE